MYYNEYFARQNPDPERGPRFQAQKKLTFLLAPFNNNSFKIKISEYIQVFFQFFHQFDLPIHRNKHFQLFQVLCNHCLTI
jgi:hypothetical protein